LIKFGTFRLAPCLKLYALSGQYVNNKSSFVDNIGYLLNNLDRFFMKTSKISEPFDHILSYSPFFEGFPLLFSGFFRIFAYLILFLIKFSVDSPSRT